MPEKPLNDKDVTESQLSNNVKDAREAKSGDIIAANVGENSSRIAVGKNIIQIGALEIPRFALFVGLGLLCAIGIIAAVNADNNRQTRKQSDEAVGLLKRTETPTPLPTATPLPTSTPTATPPVMPVGTFNIAVAKFTALDAEGNAIESEEASIQASRISSFLQSQTDVLEELMPMALEIWGPEIVLYSVAEGEEEQIAESLGAHILIYGSLHQLDDSRFDLEPKFYIRPVDDNSFEQASELSGEYALGRPISYRKSLAEQGEVNETLRVRVEALAQMLRGLSYMQGGNLESYKKATEVFQEIADRSEWAQLDDDTGQEILYHFLGAGYLSQAYLTEDDSDERFALLEDSKIRYEQAVELNDEYVRSLNGLSAVNFQIARRLTEADDDCSFNKELLEEVRALRKQALNSPDTQKPTSGYVDFLAYFGLGRVDFLLGSCSDERPFSPDWESAAEHYLDAEEEFNQIDEPQPFAYAVAGYVHSDLGLIFFQQMYAEAIRVQRQTEEVNELLSMATEHFVRADKLLSLADSQEAIEQNRMVMPYYITVLCLYGRGEEAVDELEDLLDRIDDSRFDFPAVEAIREEIISKVNGDNGFIPFVTWEACQGDTK